VISKISKFLKIPWFNHNKREELVVQKKNKFDTLLNFLLGVALGGAGYAILSSIVKPRCPVCKNKIERFTQECPICHSKLRWR
jgi:hypothetical protein